MADALPVGMTQLMHLNALSADLALTLQASASRSPATSRNPWSSRTFSHYADARRRTAPPHHDIDLPSSRRPPLALPQRDATARRAARQAAAARARRARSASARTDDTDDASLSTASGPDDDVAADLYGLLKKRGRKTRMPVRRMFLLRDNVLYNFRTRQAKRPSWKLSLPGAVVGLDPRTLRIVVVLDGDRTLVLYADTPEQARDWTEALAASAETECPACCCESPTPDGRVAHVTDMHSFIGDHSDPDPAFPKNLSAGSSASLDISDIARDVPDIDNWDSFRSFAALQIKTGRGLQNGHSAHRQTLGGPQEQQFGRMKYSRPRVYA